MRTNIILLTLATAFGTLGVVEAQSYGPPYDCYIYFCQTAEQCLPETGTCGQNNNVFNRVTMTPVGAGFCELQSGNGCNTNSNAACEYIYNYNVLQGQNGCGENNLQCYHTSFTSGCNS